MMSNEDDEPGKARCWTFPAKPQFKWINYQINKLRGVVVIIMLYNLKMVWFYTTEHEHYVL